MTATPEPPADAPAYHAFVFRGDRLLVLDGDPVRVPRGDPAGRFGLGVRFGWPLGSLDGTPCWAFEVDEDVATPEGAAFRDLRGLFAAADGDFFGMAGKAKQVVNWRATHRFCGRCGARPEPAEGEMALRCPRCGMMHYPRISPAVIVRITRGGRILLARSPGFPEGMRSVLAGFVEPGESLEETVRREVREEVGIEVENLRYFGSQPWPFPNSLMIGMTADYAGGEIEPQPGEIEDAAWYRSGELPQLPPRVSIARRLIDDFVEGS